MTTPDTSAPLVEKVTEVIKKVDASLHHSNEYPERLEAEAVLAFLGWQPGFVPVWLTPEDVAVLAGWPLPYHPKGMGDRVRKAAKAAPIEIEVWPHGHHRLL